MREMAVYLEDAIDVHDRHWKIHWMLNFAQFASTTNLNAVIAEVRGGEDPGLMGRLQSSLEDRNWDSIEDLWKIKEEVKGDDELKAAFEGETATDVLDALDALGARPAPDLRAHRGAPGDVRQQGDLVARVRLQDLARGPGADHRGDHAATCTRLRLPVEHRRRSATTSRRPSAR